MCEVPENTGPVGHVIHSVNQTLKPPLIPMQSVPITTKFVSSNPTQAERTDTTLCDQIGHTR
jgi:hypothetical protein